MTYPFFRLSIPFTVYVRGINNGPDAVTMQANLYYAPANLLLHPDVWQTNGLTTADGSDSVDVTASTNAIGVSGEPFVWTDAPAAPQGSDFYSFVARVSSTDDPNPIPSISSWLDMGTLLTQNLNYGFRTTCHVPGAGVGWCHWLGFSMPSGITDPGPLTFTVSASGLSGCTVTLFANTLLPDASSVLFGPQPISSSTFVSSLSAALPVGFSTSFAVVCYNPSGQPIASGSMLTVAVSYAVPPSELDEAIDRKLLHPRYLHWEPTAVGLQPQPVVLLGEASFIVS
jgi:hypothetical protein